MENKCTHADKTFVNGPYFCDLDNKICLLEDNLLCDLYEVKKNDNGE
jgi:hypothetical protein